MDKTTLSFRPQGEGKYKTARAYVRLDPGEGRFIINGEPAGAYFAENPRWQKALAPFKAAGSDEETFDIQARVIGRAKSWSKRQPRALAHAIAGALTALDPGRHDQLWQAGFRFKVLSGPDWILELPIDVWSAFCTDPDELWARHHALFRGPVPQKWLDNPHVLTFGGRWLLDILLVPLKDDDLIQVRDYLDEQDQAVSDVDILRELFDITSRDDAFDRWRFTLSYRLNQKAKDLGVEFVGSGKVWRWALEGAPIEKPERHQRLRGTEGLTIKYVEAEQVKAELTGDDEPLDEPAEELMEEWKPTRRIWEYVLTYYDWDKRVLPFNRQAREMIPPLSEGQQRAVLRFMAEQVADEPFEVTLYAHSRAPWLQGMGLQELFVGYLVPGARIWVDRTEEPGLYKIRYRHTEPQCRRLLFFKEGRVRPVIEERKITCEVDETMLLAEGRYSNIEALDRLDLADRRTAPKVLARVFELIGLKDESQDVYCACFDDLFPLLCITKPYSRDYVKQILYDRKNYPWFYSDEERGVGWFVYDPEQDEAGVKRRHPPQPPKKLVSELWAEIARLDGQRLRTLGQDAIFDVLGIDDKAVRIKVDSSNQRYSIYRQELESVWDALKQRGELQQTAIRNELGYPNPTYAAALLAELPDVEYETKPIRLMYRPALAKPESPPEQPTPPPTEKVGNYKQVIKALVEYLQRFATVEPLRVGRMPGTYLVDGNTALILKYSRYHEEKSKYFFGLLQDHFWELHRSYADLYFLAICGDTNKVVVIPGSVLAGIGEGVTSGDQLGYWKIEIFQTAKGYELYLGGSGKPRHECMAYLNNYPFLTRKPTRRIALQLTEEGELEEETPAFLLGLILGKGEINRSSNTVTITLQYGHYKDSRITGGGVAFDEREALPKGAEQVYARLKPLAIDYESLASVNLRQRGLYRYELILEFITDQHGLLNTILAWYPTGSSNADFDFPTAKLESAPVEIAKAFMQGYACATGLLTDTTRAGPAGRHRVFIRAAAGNREILNNVRWLLEQRLNVPVAHIHWHEGRDPQLRVYAEDFEKIGFGLYWEDQILTACARENREGSPTSSQNQPRLFNNSGSFHSD